MVRFTHRLVAYIGSLLLLTVVYASAYRWGMTTLEGEPRAWYQAFEVVVQSMTTTGYGQDAPWQTRPMTVLVVLIQLTGIAYIFVAIPLFVVPWLERIVEPTPPESVGDLESHVVVLGYTALCESLVNELAVTGTQYLVIESDLDAARDLHEDGLAVIHGDPAADQTLDNAQLEDARAVVVDASDHEQVSTIIELAGREERPRIFALVADPSRARYLRYAGADEVVSPRHRLGKALGDRVRPVVEFADGIDWPDDAGSDGGDSESEDEDDGNEEGGEVGEDEEDGEGNGEGKDGEVGGNEEDGEGSEEGKAGEVGREGEANQVGGEDDTDGDEKDGATVPEDAEEGATADDASEDDSAPERDGVATVVDDLRLVEYPIEPDSDLYGEPLSTILQVERDGATVLGAWARGDFLRTLSSSVHADENTTLLVAGTDPDGDLEAVAAATGSDGSRYRPMREPVVVVGSGIVGTAAAGALERASIDHRVLDWRDDDLADAVGDVTTEAGLEAADVSEAGTVVLALEDDEPALLTTLVARELNPDLEIFAAANLEENVSRIRDAGADFALGVATVAGRMLALRIYDHEPMTFSDRLAIHVVAVPSLHDETLDATAITSETGCDVVGIERDGDLLTDVDGRTVRSGDRLVIAGTEDGRAAFCDRFDVDIDEDRTDDSP